MQRFPAHLRAALAALAAAAVTLAGVVAPAPGGAAAAPVRLVVPADIGELPGPVEMRELVEFRIVDKELLVLTTLPPTGGTKRVAVDGLDGTARVSVHVRSRPDVPTVGLYFRLMHTSPESEGGPNVQTTVYSRPGYLEVSRVTTRTDSLSSVTLTQRSAASAAAFAANDDRVALRIRRVDTSTNQTTDDRQLKADSMIDLMRHAPRETAEHLGPIFRTFGQEGTVIAADLQLAWQVLADVLPADPGVAPDVRSLVADLDADDFHRREAAYAGLQRLGGPAALVLLRRDAGLGQLSAHQRAKLAAFLADYRPLTDAEAAERRHDPDFLLSCVAYSAEPAIRRAAAAALAPHDPASRAPAVARIDDADRRVIAAQALRSALSPSPAPSRPAATSSSPSSPRSTDWPEAPPKPGGGPTPPPR